MAYMATGDGIVGVDEYRLDCVSRAAFSNIKEIDDAYNALLTVSIFAYSRWYCTLYKVL